jgi:hypothetical protein
MGFVFSSAATVQSADRMTFGGFRKPKRNDFDRRSAKNLSNWPHCGRKPLALFFGPRTGSSFRNELKSHFFFSFELRNL